MLENEYCSVKNYQTDELIKKLYSNYFNKRADNLKISILSGGMKNAVYLLEDGELKIVLKIAPRDETKMITVDRNIFWWEAKMLKYMEKLNVPSPKLLFYDNSCSICSTPYIFMTYIDGKNYLSIKDDLDEKIKNNIEYQIGKISYEISSLKNSKFFIPSNPNKQFNNNFEFINYLFEQLINDANEKDEFINFEICDEIKNLLFSKKNCLNNIHSISLCHTDIWDGNIIVKDGVVTGIVDFSDLYFCDELMTFYFHTIDGKTSANFLKGYNNKILDYDEIVRIEIYRMYVILKMIVDCKLKQYGKFQWMYENLDSRINTLKRI